MQAVSALTLSCPPSVIYSVLTDWRRYPEWKPNVKRVQQSGSDNAWLEYSSRAKPRLYSFSRLERNRIVEISEMVKGGRGLFLQHTYQFDIIQPDLKVNDITLQLSEKVYVANPVLRVLIRLLRRSGEVNQEFFRKLQRQMEKIT